MLAFSPLAAPTSAAYHVVNHLADWLGPVGGTATAIVVFTVLVRLILHPLTRAAVRGERSRQRLAPQIVELRKRHQGDTARLSEAVLALHQKEGVTPFAGMLPLLAQAPFFLITYQIFVRTEIGGQVNELLTRTLFGTPMGAHLWESETFLNGHIWVFGGLLAGLGVLAWLTARRSVRLTAVYAARNDPAPAGPNWLARLPRILPYITVVTALFVPLAAGLYILTSSAWTLAENVLLRRGLPG